ncbi:MAG: DUF421 domain-containing protein [Ruminococcaceae bacterium]|nr:DUF421 domain-containing protein [Oscillospiraceae bacterium]
MLTIFVRTVIIYILLIGTMRLMGKRQLGELEVSELVTTLLVSEIASLPIADQDIPVVYAVIPLVTILAFEIMLSMILVKCPALKNVVSARPTVLIRHGVLDQKEMRRIRISLDELISEIRQSGLATPEDVDYAILEQNGKISIIPKRAAQPPSARDLSLSPEEGGVIHALIEDGKINRYNLDLLNLSDDWLISYLKKEKTELKKIFFLGINDIGELYRIDMEDTR